MARKSHLVKNIFIIVGKYVNHKGRNRNFTSEDELEQERKNEEAKKKYVIQTKEFVKVMIFIGNFVIL